MSIDEDAVFHGQPISELQVPADQAADHERGGDNIAGDATQSSSNARERSLGVAEAASAIRRGHKVLPTSIRSSRSTKEPS